MNKKELEKLQEMSDHDLLVELVKSQRKDAEGQRITALCSLLMFVVLSAALLIIVPKVITTLNTVETAVQQTTTLMQQTQSAVQQTTTLVDQAQQSLDGIDDMVSNVNQLVEDNTQQVNDAMTNFNSVDFERLNQAIDDLASIVEPLANLLGGH